MQGKTIQLKIATPEKLIYEAVVDHVSLPTVDGEITILPGHVSLITRISRGEIIAGEKNEKVPFVIVGGFAEINGESVIVLADYAEDLREMTESHIETARARAEELKRMKEEKCYLFNKGKKIVWQEVHRLQNISGSTSKRDD